MDDSFNMDCSKRFKPCFWEPSLNGVGSEPIGHLHWSEFVLRVYVTNGSSSTDYLT